MRKQLAIALLGVVMTVSGVLSGPAYTALAAEESGTGEQAEAAAETEAPAAEQQEADEAPVKQDASAEEEETVEVTAEESGAEAETMEPALQVADASGMEAAGVPPFGNPRVKGYLHLTVAYRSLSRPSSPLRA